VAGSGGRPSDPSVDLRGE